MSIQQQIANDQMTDYLNAAHESVTDLWFDTVEIAERMVQQRPDAAIAAVASLLVNQWGHCGHIEELGQQAHRYALGMAEAHEYDVGETEIPDDLEGLTDE